MKGLVLFAVISCFLVGAEKHSKWTPKSTKRTNKTSQDSTVNQENITRVETVNGLSDVILKNIPPIMNKYKLNPFFVPGQKQSIYPVNLELDNIKLYNLTSVHRVSDLIILNDEFNRQLITTLKLKFDDLILVCDYNAYIKVFPYTPAIGSEGILKAVVSEIAVDIKVTVDFKDVNATLNSLELSTNRQHIKVELSGNLERYVLNIAMPVIVYILQEVLLSIIQEPLKKQINAVLHEISGMINGFFLNVNA